MTIIGIVSAIIGFVIVDGIMTDATNTFGQTDEITALLSTNVSLSQDDIDSVTSVKNSSTTLDTSNYTVHMTDGNFELLESSYNNTKLNATYQYKKDEYFEGSISRTVGGYVVPIGLLGVLALAAMFVI